MGQRLVSLRLFADGTVTPTVPLLGGEAGVARALSALRVLSIEATTRFPGGFGGYTTPSGLIVEDPDEVVDALVPSLCQSLQMLVISPGGQAEVGWVFIL